MRLLLGLVLMVGMAAPARGGDYDQVIRSAREVWPERRTVVVVCNKDASSMALMDLGSATEKAISLLVVNLASPRDIEKVVANVTRKPWNEIFVLLIADDPVAGDASQAGGVLVARMTARGIPVVGTTQACLKLGAVFAVGPGTGDKLVTNPEAAKKVGVPLPANPAPTVPAATAPPS
jgi:ABC-type uncharacterized transport system substrate-binding protein